MPGTARSLTPSPWVGSLHTVKGVRIELAKVYKDCRQGRLPASEGAKLAFILLGLGRLIEGSDLEARLRKLEEAEKYGLTYSETRED